MKKEVSLDPFQTNFANSMTNMGNIYVIFLEPGKTFKKDLKVAKRTQ